MASSKAEITIDRKPEDVWSLVREFGRLADYMPGVESCTLDGDVRTIGMMGIEVKEQLRDLDDDTRRITYSVIASPIPNLESHSATIAVDPEGAGTHLTWSCEVAPDELIAIFEPTYQQSVAALKAKLES